MKQPSVDINVSSGIIDFSLCNNISKSGQIESFATRVKFLLLAEKFQAK